MSTMNSDELIVYPNSRNGLGIRILGAKRATHKTGVYIKQLLEDGLAQREGRLKVGDQIMSINDQSAVGVSREHAVNLLRTSAATNQVRLRIRHFYPSLSAPEYQKFLFDEKSTDDEEDNNRRQVHTQNRNNNNNITTTNEVRMRRSSRRHQQQHRHSTQNVLYDNRKEDDDDVEERDDRLPQGIDVSQDALQSLLNSRFKLIDLFDLLKKTYPLLLNNDQRRETQFMEQMAESNADGRVTLKDFERQSSVLLGERINLLVPFYRSSRRSSITNDANIVHELRREIAACRTTIDDLQNKISACEQSQRLSYEVELEYEDLLKFVDEQLRMYKINENIQTRQLQANDQLIQKLFGYLSGYVNKPSDEHTLAQLKFEYQQQQKMLPTTHRQTTNSSSLTSMNKYQQQV